MLLPNVFDPFTLFKKRNNESPDTLYFFKGMICYYGSHYFSYFRDLDNDDEEEEGMWFLYDD